MWWVHVGMSSTATWFQASSLFPPNLLLLFCLTSEQQFLKSVTVTKWLRVIAVPNHIYLILIPLQFCFFFSTKTVAPAPCLYWPSLGWHQAVRTIQVSCWPHACSYSLSGRQLYPLNQQEKVFRFSFYFCFFEALPSNSEVCVSLFYEFFQIKRVQIKPLYVQVITHQVWCGFACVISGLNGHGTQLFQWRACDTLNRQVATAVHGIANGRGSSRAFFGAFAALTHKDASGGN